MKADESSAFEQTMKDTPYNEKKSKRTVNTRTGKSKSDCFKHNIQNSPSSRSKERKSGACEMFATQEGEIVQFEEGVRG